MDEETEARQIAQRAEMDRQTQVAAAGYAGKIMGNPDFRVVTGVHPELGDMDDLSAQPGTPGYYAKLRSSSRPAPDPTPPASPLILPTTVSPVTSGPAAATLMGVNAAEPSTKRISIGLGRGDDFVVAVEEAPDWEATDSWKISPDRLLALAPILRALGVKIVDRSAGEFKALERDRD